MSHQAIDFLARDRINGLAREAAGTRLAREGRPRARNRRSPSPRLLGRSIRGIVARSGAVASGVRSLVARAW